MILDRQLRGDRKAWAQGCKLACRHEVGEARPLLCGSKPLQGYSLRSHFFGSNLAARNAGIQAAHSVAAAKNEAALLPVARKRVARALAELPAPAMHDRRVHLQRPRHLGR